jgi:hypothetical protein
MDAAKPPCEEKQGARMAESGTDLFQPGAVRDAGFRS